MAENEWKLHFTITDIRDHSVQQFSLGADSRDLKTQYPNIIGWSIGHLSSDAPIKLDEKLEDCAIGIFPVSYHRVLCGVATDLPEVWLPKTNEEFNLVPFMPERWRLIDRAGLAEFARWGGNVYCRFDFRPIRIGNYIIKCGSVKK